MSEQNRADLCIIGAGSGGLSLAAGAAQLGARIILIEKAHMGGDCLNVGCVPSKALIAAARRAHTMRSTGPFGIAPVAPTINHRGVRDHVQSVIAAIAPNDSVERFTGLGVEVIQGTARFKDRRTIVVGDREITARRFVIATGSSPAVPPIAGLDHVPFFTNETMTIVVVKLSNMADIKNVIIPTTHIKFLFFLEVMTSVTTLNPSNMAYRIRNTEFYCGAHQCV